MIMADIMAEKGCNADTWPDGEGSFHMSGALGWTIPEVVERMDTLDWSEGAQRTSRTAHGGGARGG